MSLPSTVTQSNPVSETFSQKHGNVSLAHALFNNVDMVLGLQMIRNGKIDNLNEISPDGLTLLGHRLETSTHLSDQEPLPSWSDWQQDPQSTWDRVVERFEKSQGTNLASFAAAMIFAGADPWIIWKPLNGMVSTSSAGYALFAQQTALFETMLSHPACPAVSVLEEQCLYNIKLLPETNATIWHHANPEKERQGVPWLHYAANLDNPKLLALLLDKGLSPSVQDANGRTALFYCRNAANAKLLMARGAKLQHVDANNKSVVQFWRSWFRTAQKLSEMNAMAIDAMKKDMPLKDLQDIQKPGLFAQILSGTKTGFLGIYRKSKFEPTVVWEDEEGRRCNIITAALASAKNKASILNWWTEHNMGWDDHVVPGTPLTTAMLSNFFINSNAYGRTPSTHLFGPSADTLIKTYASLPPDQRLPSLIRDQYAALEALSGCALSSIPALKTLGKCAPLMALQMMSFSGQWSKSSTTLMFGASGKSNLIQDLQGHQEPAPNNMIGWDNAFGELMGNVASALGVPLPPKPTINFWPSEHISKTNTPCWGWEEGRAQDYVIGAVEKALYHQLRALAQQIKTAQSKGQTPPIDVFGEYLMNSLVPRRALAIMQQAYSKGDARWGRSMVVLTVLMQQQDIRLDLLPLLAGLEDPHAWMSPEDIENVSIIYSYTRHPTAQSGQDQRPALLAFLEQRMLTNMVDVDHEKSGGRRLRM